MQIIISSIFGFQAGIYAIILLDRYSVAIPISVACLTEVIVFAYSYGKSLFHLAKMTEKTFCVPYRVKYITD